MAFGLYTSFKTGAAGRNGWTPVYAIETLSDGFAVHKLVDYVGGTGTKPTANIDKYVGAAGFVVAPEEGVNLKGAAGKNAWRAVTALEESNEKVFMKLVDWADGTGAKPAIPTDPYFTASGFGVVANAINLRGADGKVGNDGQNGSNGTNGDNGWTAQHAPYYRTPTEVVLKIVGYTGGTGTPPELPVAEIFGGGDTQADPVGEFLQSDGSYGRLATAARINPEDSLSNRLANIKLYMETKNISTGKIPTIIQTAKAGIAAWIASNQSQQDYAQVDALSVFKSAFRSMAFYTSRGVTAEALATLPVSVVMPNLLQEIDSQFEQGTTPLYPYYIDVFRMLFKAVIDFDGELESTYLLGDISDATSQDTIDGLAGAFDMVVGAIL